MLKGKSTIQLFNAKSGKLEHQEENVNIVTNAIPDIINYSDPFGFAKRLCITSSASSPSYYKGVVQYEYMLPFPTVAFGGLFLWDSNIAEDQTITMPPDGVMEIGHAGKEYSGGNLFRGSYNTNESGIIDEDDRKGYRHVWDFGSDKANGTIKSLSLTSLLGGNKGYCNSKEAFNEETDAYGLASNYGTTNQLTSELTTFSSIYNDTEALSTYNIIYMKKEINSIDLWVTHYRNNTKRTEIVKVTIPLSLNILSLTSDRFIHSNSKVLVSDLGFSGSNLANSMYLYNGEIYCCYTYQGILYIKSWTLEGNSSVNVSITPSRAPYQTDWDMAFFYNGIYYYRTGYEKYSKCDISGEDLGDAFEVYNFEDRGNYGGGSGVKVMPDGNIYFMYNYNYSNMNYYGEVIISPDGNYFLEHEDNTSNRHMPITSIKSPFIYRFVWNNQKQSATTAIDVDPRYLATINNLATPVTKTKSQTMKVIYEITEA